MNEELISNLKHEVSLTKRAYLNLEAENTNLMTAKADIEEERDDLQSKLKVCAKSFSGANTVLIQPSQPNRLVVLIDGDGAIFDLGLIADGLAGGLNAAQQLSSAIMDFLPTRAHHQL